MPELNKGGVTWLEFAFERNNGGLEVWVKADVRLEEFIKSVSSPHLCPLSELTNEWQSLPGAAPLQIYSTNLKNTLSYELSGFGNGFGIGSEGIINLSFLRFVGISSPEGIRFTVKGPFSKTYISDISRLILKGSREFLQDYIVPVHINLKVSSQSF